LLFIYRIGSQFFIFFLRSLKSLWIYLKDCCAIRINRLELIIPVEAFTLFKTIFNIFIKFFISHKGLRRLTNFIIRYLEFCDFFCVVFFHIKCLDTSISTLSITIDCYSIFDWNLM
jgi:hypothetical protein